MGIQALGGYLGGDKQAWRNHDAVALIEDGASYPEFLVDVGDADRSSPNNFGRTCSRPPATRPSIPLNLRRQPGYDHSYYFISTLMEDHLRWHAAHLNA